MHAAVVHEFGENLTIDEVPVPTPGPGQALVKLIRSGVCHTDLHAMEGDWPVKPSPPFIPGHEGVGEIVALGADADDLAIGDLVGNAWLWSTCGSCQYCRTGWETLCEAQQNGGYSVDGSFGQYMLVDSRFAVRIPYGADPIFDIVLKGLTIRGSIVGTRQDMEEALPFYARGQIHPTVSERRLDEVNEVLDEMKHGNIDGRVVIRY
ncbi:alcohol dehydrogenase catalytic domain-containing protein [Cryobacterium sp. Y29]|uniref:alcohol dehydrogenase catalytic domain-containing protein n=1 Tax=Cryobacterium sp. Y29 TaxID=2048285 RepID=UPI000CE3D293|nr:alcohol dehydrogenase catalytic domain-containing protein [Cryobacterium sp. Y29]